MFKIIIEILIYLIFDVVYELIIEPIVEFLIKLFRLRDFDLTFDYIAFWLIIWSLSGALIGFLISLFVFRGFSRSVIYVTFICGGLSFLISLIRVVVAIIDRPTATPPLITPKTEITDKDRPQQHSKRKKAKR